MDTVLTGSVPGGEGLPATSCLRVKLTQCGMHGSWRLVEPRTRDQGRCGYAARRHSAQQRGGRYLCHYRDKSRHMRGWQVNAGFPARWPRCGWLENGEVVGVGGHLPQEIEKPRD